MKERPILFTPENAAKIARDEKWQTRRVIFKDDPRNHMPWWCQDHWQDGDLPLRCPYGLVGDQLWVREAWATVKTLDYLSPAACYQYDRPPMVWYKSVDVGASLHSPNRGKWRHARYMPRWACQLFLDITEVRVERLQDISEEDAIAEGAKATAAGDGYPFAMPARMNFVDLWDAINGDQGHGWAENPWVWAITFRRVLP